MPLKFGTHAEYTYTQKSSPIYLEVKLSNHVELLLLMSVWLDYCLTLRKC